MTLTRQDVARLLEWFGFVQDRGGDTLEDYELMERLQVEEQRLWREEKTQ